MPEHDHTLGPRQPQEPEHGLTRRSLLRSGAAIGAGAAVAGGVVGGFVGHGIGEDSGNTGATEPFYGRHQSGIITQTQRQMVFAAFDVNDARRDELIAILRRWSQLGAALSLGESVTIPIYTPARSAGVFSDAIGGTTTDDSFEAYELGPNRLTLTIGFGRSLFVTPDGKDRFGLGQRLPPALIELPHFSGDQLVQAQSGGDLMLQACADDPQVAMHAVRSIGRIAPDLVTLKWTQTGFTPVADGGTPRNLMGFKDGTVNSNLHPPADMEATLWAGAEGPAWMRDGSYLVYRRIRMDLDHWDRVAPNLQEQVFGRYKLSGAPLGETSEFAPLNLDARHPNGTPVVPVDAHVRLAAPQSNDGAVIVRRAFAYDNGTKQFVERWPPWRQELEYDAGLVFLAYQKDPRTAFVPIFSRLAEVDQLNQFTTHNASALFAVPPAATGPGDWVGRRLFE